MKSISKLTNSYLKCGICNKKLDNISTTYFSKFIQLPACENCKNQFSKEDLEIMLNMFLAYGGYFGQFSRETFSFKKYMKCLEIIQDSNSQKSEKIYVFLLHTALLHGIAPQQYFSELKF